MAGDRTSKSQDKRKSSKPLMEKRRRARINECLSELQGILELVNHGQSMTTGGHSKKEKAEILEATVELVRHLRHQNQTGRPTSIPSEPLPQAQYRAGFNECLGEVSRFMEANHSALNAETQSGLLNHLAYSLRSSANSLSTCNSSGSINSGWTAGQFGPIVRKSTPEAQRETELARRPVFDRRGCTVSGVVPPQVPMTSPPKASVPPLAPAPPLPPPSTSVQICHSNTVHVQQSPKKGDHPISASLPAMTSPGVPIPVNTAAALSPPAGHVALVLPAHLLSSFVSGQFTTGHVIPVFQHQGGTSLILQSHSVPNSDSIVGGGAIPSPASGQASNLNHCALSPPSSNAEAGHVFLVPSPIVGCVPSKPPNGRQAAPSTSLDVGRSAPPVPNPPPTSSSLVAINKQNGVVYAPASLPMQLYVAPSVCSGGIGGPFANGLSLPNPPPTHSARDPHWRPWGWEQKPR